MQKCKSYKLQHLQIHAFMHTIEPAYKIEESKFCCTCTCKTSSELFLLSSGSIGLFNMSGEEWNPIMRDTWGSIIGCHSKLSKLWKHITYKVIIKHAIQYM
jgi:hypothetical protein